MPRPKFSESVNNTRPEFKAYELPTAAMMVLMNNQTVLNILNPKLAEKFGKLQYEHNTSCKSVNKEYAPKGDFFYPQSNTAPVRYGGDPKIADELMDVMDEIAEYGEHLDQTLPKEAEPVKNFIKAQFSLVTNSGGSVTELYNDNQFMDGLFRFLTYGPIMPTKKQGDKTVIDYEKMVANLKGNTDPETGKDDGILEPLMDIYGAITELVNLEMTRQKNEKNGWTEKNKQSYLTGLKKNMDTVSDAFERMKEAEKKHPGKYDSKVMNNPIQDITGSVYDQIRDLNYVVGFLRGQSKAIENGWEPEELFALGSMAALNEDIIKAKRDILQKTEADKKKIANARKKIEENNRKIEELNKNGYKPRTANDITLEIAGLEVDSAPVQAAHNDYVEKLAELEKNKAKNAAKITKLKEDNAENEKELEKSKAKLNALINELSNPPKDEREKLREDNEKQAKDIKTYEDELKSLDGQFKNISKLEAEFNPVYKEISEKKIKDLNDKKEVFGKIKKLKDLVEDNPVIQRSYKKIIEPAEKSFKKLEEKLEYGYLPEINSEDDRQLNLTRIYGNNIYWNPLWGKKSADRNDIIITKKDFVDNIKMYKNASGLPLNDMEIAFLGVAGTYSAEKQNRTIRDNKYIKNDDDLMRSNSGLWTFDIMRNKEDPREGLYKYAPIIKSGREKADHAFGEYKKGNKDEMAALVHAAFSMAVKNWDERSVLRSDAYFSFCLTKTLRGLLERDKGLRESFDKINNSKPANEKVDLARIKRIENISEIRVKGYEITENYRVQAEKREKQVEEEKKTNNRNKTKIDDANAKIEIIDTKLALLEGKKKKTEKELGDIKKLLSQRRGEQGEIELIRKKEKEDAANQLIEKRAYEALSKSTMSEILKGNLMHELYQEVDRSLLRKPEIMDLAIAQSGQKGEANPNEQAAVAFYQAAKFNHEPAAFAYFQTAEGKKKLNGFSDYLVDKYKLSPDRYEKLKNGRVPAKEKADSETFNTELRIFGYEMENAGIIERLRTEELSEQQRREMTAEYIKNNYFLRENERALQTGKTDDFVAASTNSSKIIKNEAKYRRFENGIDEYVKNMNFKDLDGKGLADLLYANSFKKNRQRDYERRSEEEDFFHEIAKNVRNEVEFGSFAEKVSAGKKPELNLKAKLKNLTEAGYDIVGSKSEFKKFVKELKDFDRYVRKADLEWDIKRVYPGEELAKKEKELSEKISAFAENQNEGLRNALSEIKSDIDRRYKFDKTAVTIDNEMVESVKAYRADHEVLKEVEGTKKQLSDAEARTQYNKTLSGLDKMIEREERRREVLAEEMKAVKKTDKKAYQDSFDEMVSSAFFGLYLNILRNDYEAKPGMGSKELLENEARLKKAVSTGCDKNVINNMLKTDFGVQFSQKLHDEAEKNEPALSQANILQYRDGALNKAFGNLAGEKAAQIKKIAQVLQSDVLNNKGKNLKPSADDSKFELDTLIPKKNAAKKTL